MPLPDENSVESMRASRSSIMCRIFCFHRAGMIWRTGALGRFEGAESAPPGTLETSCLDVAANPRRFYGLGDSRFFYPSRRQNPMVRPTILMVTPNAITAFLAPETQRACPRPAAPPRRADVEPIRKTSDFMTAPP